MPVASVCTCRISVSTLKLFVVLSRMLEDAERTTIGSYGMSGIGTVRKNYIEHASCHVTIDAFSRRNSEHNQHLATCRMSGIPLMYRAAWFGELPVHAKYEI